MKPEDIQVSIKAPTAAEIACQMFGIAQAPRVEQLAVSAIEAREAARLWLLENPK